MNDRMKILLASLMICGTSANAYAQATLIADASEFETLTGTTALSDFEDVSVGAYPTVATGGLLIDPVPMINRPTPTVSILDQLVGLPAQRWFGDNGSGGKFLLTNLHSIAVTFPVDLVGFGFSAGCFGCDPTDHPSSWLIELYSDSGANVGRFEQVQALPFGGAFVGVVSAQRFRAAVITRQSSGNWMLDDLRESAADPVLLTDDPGQFESLVATNAVIGFEDVAIGETLSVTSGGVRIKSRPSPEASQSPLSVLDELVGLPSNFWFGPNSTGMNFLLANASSMTLKFRHDQLGFALSAACFACDTPEQPSNWTIELYDSDTNLVGYLRQEQRMSVNGGLFGIASLRPFRYAVMTRSGGGNWLLDDIRYHAPLKPDRGRSDRR